MRGDLKPGERLVEHKLAKALGIGQPTLREALKELEHQGFVRKTPKRGTHVTVLTREDFRKVLEVRMALEVVAIERAAVRLTDGGAHQLGEHVRAMESAAARFDLADFHRNDVAFHRLLWDAADNEFLTLALERVAFGLFAFVLLQRDVASTNEFVAAAQQHKEILEGLASRDPVVARDAFVRSTLRFWNEYHQVGFTVGSNRFASTAASS